MRRGSTARWRPRSRVRRSREARETRGSLSSEEARWRPPPRRAGCSSSWIETRSSSAAFDLATGKITGRVTRRHRAVEFLAFLRQIDASTPTGLDLHLILDNSSTHQTAAVRRWIEAHPSFHLHFTPTSASWLNAVESWFAQLERRAVHRGVFTSVSALRDEIHRYIQVHNERLTKPFRWTKSAESIIQRQQRLQACQSGTN